MIQPDMNAVAENPMCFLITQTNKIEKFSDCTIELPVNWFRIPIGEIKDAVFAGGGIFDCATCYYFIRRYDHVNIDDMLFKAWATTIPDAKERSQAEEEYHRNALKSVYGEQETNHSVIEYSGGKVHFAVFASKLTSPHEVMTKRYRSVFIPEGCNGLSLYGEVFVSYSSNARMIIEEYNGMAVGVLDIFRSLKMQKA